MAARLQVGGHTFAGTRDRRLRHHLAVTCEHPEHLLELTSGYLFTCRGCGFSSVFGAVEGRPLEGGRDSILAYRAAHPETRIGADL